MSISCFVIKSTDLQQFVSSVGRLCVERGTCYVVKARGTYNIRVSLNTGVVKANLIAVASDELAKMG